MIELNCHISSRTQPGLTKATCPYRLGESVERKTVFLMILVVMITVMMVMRMGRVSPPLNLAAVRIKKER